MYLAEYEDGLCISVVFGYFGINGRGPYMEPGNIYHPLYGLHGTPGF